jgi:hypothetical protein
MAITDQTRTRAREERIAAILRTHRPLTFEEMLGPEPEPGDSEDLQAFLDFLHSRHEPVRVPDSSE